MSRADKGMYQCVVDGSVDTSGGGGGGGGRAGAGGDVTIRRTAQAEAVLELGGK